MADKNKPEKDVKNEEVEQKEENTVAKTDVTDNEKQETSEQPIVPEKPHYEPEPENSSVPVEPERNDDMPKMITKNENGKFDYTNCKTYVTKRGDTLYSVAQEFGVPMQQLRYFNNLAPQSRLPIGRKMYIPNGIVDIPNGE